MSQTITTNRFFNLLMKLIRANHAQYLNLRTKFLSQEALRRYSDYILTTTQSTNQKSNSFCFKPIHFD